MGIPVGVSNRHVHLSQADLDRLFGPGYELTKMKDLSSRGSMPAKEMVTVCGPKGAIEKVRILGPVRRETQVEILAGDGFKLGVKAPVRLSGDLMEHRELPWWARKVLYRQKRRNGCSEAYSYASG